MREASRKKSLALIRQNSPACLKGQRGLFFYRLFVVVLLRLLVSVVPLFIGVFFLGKGLSQTLQVGGFTLVPLSS